MSWYSADTAFHLLFIMLWAIATRFFRLGQGKIPGLFSQVFSRSVELSQGLGNWAKSPAQHTEAPTFLQQSLHLTHCGRLFCYCVTISWTQKCQRSTITWNKLQKTNQSVLFILGGLPTQTELKRIFPGYCIMKQTDLEFSRNSRLWKKTPKIQEISDFPDAVRILSLTSTKTDKLINLNIN